MMQVAGGCHCRAIRYVADVDEDAQLIDCNCSICAMAGYLHLIVPTHRFRLLSGKEALIEYRFGTGRARHLFCRICGIKSFYRPRSHPDGISLNARCLDGGVPPLPVRTFDGRNWEAAIAGLP
ncbi:MAG: GFA family protein [Sphingomonadaceae bacterium]|uniref:GFA family protein n=1 Tax=Thermaurantiacus sp. TaxID=2820283 RepID=UPI00298F1E1F|nr:GFA family protein [Thermaurantiacus sp.]MCS6987333.1 GFA family protein [Sphingomonadaceae bacterium]MDW8414554.1 GFA family protein [Thermaurantiacus sp.]